MADQDKREKLYQNARDSIDMGITDYSSNHPTRVASGVRNFYSGLLILAKYVLAMKAPDADIMSVIGRDFEPIPTSDGNVEFVPKRGKTIDFQEIAGRFKKFGIQIEQDALIKLNRIRTDVEHFYTSENPDAIREVMARAFPLAISLFHLAGKEPRDELGDTWDVIIDIQEVYDRELSRCRSSFKNVEWLSQTLANAPYNCPICHSDLVIQDDPKWSKSHDAMVRCLACGERIDPQRAMERALELYFEAESHIAGMEGVEGPIGTCPECGTETYIMTEDEVGCANCELALGECARCCVGLTPENVDDEKHGLCSYCADLFRRDD